jgi:hypothetical protein
MQKVLCGEIGMKSLNFRSCKSNDSIAKSEISGTARDSSDEEETDTSLSTDYGDYFCASLKGTPRSKPKKSVQFASKCKVILICTRKELIPIASDLWWTMEECRNFQKDALADIIKLKKTFGFSVKESMFVLYQNKKDVQAATNKIINNEHVVEYMIPVDIPIFSPRYNPKFC